MSASPDDRCAADPDGPASDGPPPASAAPRAEGPAGDLQALLWDVDGTLAETELDGHRRAFNRAFADEGLPWRWDVPTYLQLLAVSGGRERLRAFLSMQEGAPPTSERIERLQTRKQAHYLELVRSGAVALREGVARLIGEAAASGLRQAIVTTSSRTAVEALLATSPTPLRQAFDFWICGEDVQRKKPDPEAYRLALARLGLASQAVLAIEDSLNGLQAASAAGLGCLITISRSSRTELAGDGDGGRRFQPALALLDGLGETDRPLRTLAGPACPEGQVTVAWLRRLSREP